MPILNTPNQQPPGLANVLPTWIYIETNDTVATVTTAGYLTNALNFGWSFNNEQLALVLTSDSGVIQCKVNVSVGEIVSLTAISISGNSVISVGSNGVAGELDIYPSTANKGYRKLVAANNAANYIITETNASFGQSTTVTMPDPGVAAARDVIAPTALVDDNLVAALGTSGLVDDSGIAASNVQLISGIKAQQVSWAGGSTSHGFTVTGVTTGSVAIANIVSYTTSAFIHTVVCTTDTVTLTFTADPGAVVVNLIAFIATQ